MIPPRGRAWKEKALVPARKASRGYFISLCCVVSFVVCQRRKEGVPLCWRFRKEVGKQRGWSDVMLPQPFLFSLSSMFTNEIPFTYPSV